MLIDAIYNGDCLSLLKEMADESVDLVVSSPPYNLGKEYEKRKALEHYLQEQAEVLKHCARVMKKTASIFWQVGSYSESGILIPLDIRFFPILESLGLLPRNRIAWVRQHGLHARKKFSCRYETILWFTKGESYKFKLDPIRVPQKWPNKKHFNGERKGEYSCNPDGKNPGDVWAFMNVKHNHEEQTIHPCQFPEDLIARIVLATTDNGDLVLDPYMGAGTVAVVAKDHGRHYCGAEIDENYCLVAERRLREMPDDEDSFPNLKTLRSFVNKTGKPISSYRFDMQIGNLPSGSQQSKRATEQEHLVSLEQSLTHEEDWFSRKRRGEEVVAPMDNQDVVGRIKQNKNSGEPQLFQNRRDGV